MPADNVVEFTVSEISNALRNVVEDRFGYVRVRGEITGFKGPHSSGHCYFALKDDKARLEALVWRTTLPRLKFRPEQGIEVIATGKLTTFPGKSTYQIVIEQLEPAGLGALMALLEERRKKLTAEGLFATTRKRALPYLPRVIGIITSPTGAVIRDMLHRLKDRFPVRVLLWPVTVQGETSAAEIANAIRGFGKLDPTGRIPRPDVLIVARGGGSIEDLWSFNEEIVVRAAAASAIPLISAVGHETDVTLIDHAADRRAPTPTAAAEMAVPVRGELVATVAALVARHRGGWARLVAAGRREFAAAARALPKPEDLLAIPRRTLDELSSRLGRGLSTNAHHHRLQLERSAARLSPSRLRLFIDRSGDRLRNLAGRSRRAIRVDSDRRSLRHATVAAQLRPEPIAARIVVLRKRLADIEATSRRNARRLIADGRSEVRSLAQLLRSLSYRSVLARGFTLVRAAGRPVHGAAEVATGSPLDIEFHDGSVTAIATTGAALRRQRKSATVPGGQGDLF
jgi:exodeoxyribonuclease VII large subunit